MDKEKLHDCACGGHDHDHNHGDCGCGGHDHEHNHGDCGCDGHDHEACGCGCHEHESLIVELEDENGNTVPCEVIDGFEYKENEYALVQNPEDNSVYLFKVIGEGEEGQLVVPEDDEFNEVTAYYETLLENEE